MAEFCPRVRVAVASDDPLFREGLTRIICVEADLVCVDSDPDVILADCRMAPRPLLSGAIILVAAPEDDAWAIAALASGARGILTRSASSADMMMAIRSVHSGQIWARRRVLAARIDHLSGLSGQFPLCDERLSIREREVFRYAATGIGNKELAGRLAISEATVKVHMTHAEVEARDSRSAEIRYLPVTNSE